MCSDMFQYMPENGPVGERAETTNRAIGRTTSRRGFLATAGAVGVAGLAGCSGGSNSPTETQGGSGSTEQSGTTAGTSGAQDVTVSFWHIFGGELGQTLGDMAAEFSQQNDGITIEAVNNGGYRQNLNQSLQASRAGDPPGIVQIFEVGTRLALDSGSFTPVEEILPEEQIDFDDFLPSVLNYYRMDGTLNSMPFNSSNTIMLYNKSAFEEAGLDPEQPPTTFEEVRQYSQQIVDEGVADSGISWPNVNWWPMSWMAEQGQVYFNERNGMEGEPTETYFDSEAARTLYDWWMNDLGDLYHYPGKNDWGASEKAFSQGQASMHMNSSGGLAYLLGGFREQGIEIGVGRLPTPNEEHNGHAAGGAQVWVTKKDSRTDAEREAIRKFLRNMTGAEQQALYSKSTGYFPAHSGSVDVLEEQGFFEENPLYRTSFDQLEAWTPGPATGGVFSGTLPRTATAVVDETDNMWQGKSVDDALSDLDSTAEEQLQFYERRDL